MTFSREKFITKAKQQNLPDTRIEEHLAYAYKLVQRGYPVIFSTEHLANMIGIKPGRLYFILKDREEHYTYFKMLKKQFTKAKDTEEINAGKSNPEAYREIMSPKSELRYIQKWILINVLEKALPVHDACKSYRKKVSIRHNAARHAGKKYIMRIDIAKFFDTISEKRVWGVFRGIGYNEELSDALAKICTAKHRRTYWSDLNQIEKEQLKAYVNFEEAILPQGSPLSPIISNYILLNLDKRLSIMASKNGFNYSRYADDLTFSADIEYKLPNVIMITNILKDEGFMVNKKKTFVAKIGMKQYVTGLTTTHGVHVPKAKRKLIFTHLHYCIKHGVRKHLAIRKKKGDLNAGNAAYQDWLYGNIQWIRSISPDVGDKMMKQYQMIEWKI